MILTVQERVLRAVQRRLETITTQNGYNFDVQQVYRSGILAVRPTNPPEIWMTPAGSRQVGQVDGGTHGLIDEEMPLELRFFADVLDMTEYDMSYNLFLGDIQRALPCPEKHTGSEPVRDDTYPCPGEPMPRGRTIKIDYISAQPAINPGGNSVAGRVKYNVFFRRIGSDPRLWDSGDELVEV